MVPLRLDDRVLLDGIFARERTSMSELIDADSSTDPSDPLVTP